MVGTYNTFEEESLSFEEESLSLRESGDGKTKDLVVILHGFTKSKETMYHVRDAIRATKEYKNAEIYTPDLDFGLFSTTSPHQVVVKIMKGIETEIEKLRSKSIVLKKIVLVGHSAGALFARKVYVTAWGQKLNDPEQETNAPGQSPKVPFEDDLQKLLREELGWTVLSTPRDWVKNVDRIVLMASLNRGFRPIYSIDVFRALWSSFLIATFRDFVGINHIMFNILFGSPWLTHLRLQWLEMERDRNQTATVVQLLGSTDDYVSPDDNIDLATGSTFKYIDVPFSGHASIIETGGDEDSFQKELQALRDNELSAVEKERVVQVQERRQKLQVAIKDKFDEPERRQVRPTDEELVTDDSVTDVVFVMHGIRDKGFWTRKIARKVIAAINESDEEPKRKARSVTSSYGYFPILSFLILRRRREKAEWLADQYVEARAKYRGAKRFLYVGHSQGTYLVAKAMLDNPAIRFDRIVFAGSVVHVGREWLDTCIGRHQIRRGGIFNIVTTADWAVAWGPKFLRKLHLKPGLLGSAGFDGFNNNLVAELPEPNKYLVGQHGAGKQEQLWGAITDFLLENSDTLNIPEGVELRSRRNPCVRFFSWFPLPLPWIVLLLPGGIVGGLLYWLVTVNEHANIYVAALGFVCTSMAFLNHI